MKYFLINTAKITVTVLIILGLLIFGTCLIAHLASFKISQRKNIIIVGDSSTAHAIDDNIFSRAVNASQGGTAYLYSYVKLRKLLRENSHINKVLLSFHDEAIPAQRDGWIMSDDFINQYVPYYFPLFHKDEIFLLTQNSTFYIAVTKSPINSIRSIGKFIYKRKLTYEDLGIGEYTILDRNKLEQDIRIRQNQKKTEQGGYSQYQLNYLLKIVELCNTHTVELILFNAPRYRPDIYCNESALTEYYNRYLSEIKYMDFSDFDLPKDGYADVAHLNYKGAEIFSRYLQNNYEAVFGH